MGPFLRDHFAPGWVPFARSLPRARGHSARPSVSVGRRTTLVARRGSTQPPSNGPRSKGGRRDAAYSTLQDRYERVQSDHRIQKYSWPSFEPGFSIHGEPLQS